MARWSAQVETIRCDVSTIGESPHFQFTETAEYNSSYVKFPSGWPMLSVGMTWDMLVEFVERAVASGMLSRRERVMMQRAVKRGLLQEGK